MRSIEIRKYFRKLFEEVKKLCQEVMQILQTEEVDHICLFPLDLCSVSKGQLQDIPDKLMAV